MYYPPPWPYFMNGQTTSVSDLEKMLEIMKKNKEEEDKKAKEAKDKEKKKPDPWEKVSKFDVFIFMVAISPFVGFAYSALVTWALKGTVENFGALIK